MRQSIRMISGNHIGADIKSLGHLCQARVSFRPQVSRGDERFAILARTSAWKNYIDEPASSGALDSDCYWILLSMGRSNYLIEGGSGTGKTSVCDELARRGYQAIHGDRELAYTGDPDTGAPVDVAGLSLHDHHIWNVDLVEALIEDQREPTTFFCGGSRNSAQFVYLFDRVFVLEIDPETLMRRLDERPADEWGGRGRPAERDLILRRHRTREDVPPRSILIDATVPLTEVVDDILARTHTVGDIAR